MTSRPRYEVLWTTTALEMLEAIGDRRVQQSILDTSRRLEGDPKKQGKPLREDLFGYRSLRVVGQRYRVVFSVDARTLHVHVVAAGLRQEGSRRDVYELARKLVRLGLGTSAARPPRRRKRK